MKAPMNRNQVFLLADKIINAYRESCKEIGMTPTAEDFEDMVEDAVEQGRDTDIFTPAFCVVLNYRYAQTA